MAEQYNVTSVGMNPSEDRAHRMRVYFLAMTLRVACVVSLFFVRGWWVLLVAAGAVLLPYFAVLIANQASSGREERPTPPEPLRLESPPSQTDAQESDEQQTIIVDAPAERRSTGGDA